MVSIRVSPSVLWSPYYKVVYDTETGGIETNNIGHQGMVRIEEAGPGYLLPHLLNRDAGGKPFEDVLIIGAGSGNDVQAALTHGAKHVDAVEIDPVLNEIGRRHHPDRPYDDPRVSIHFDDGRSFVRKTTKDLRPGHLRGGRFAGAPFGLFEPAAGELPVHRGGLPRHQGEGSSPGGVFAMYNFYRQGWVVGRLAKMAEKVFGTKPLVISLPYQAEDHSRG